jgi:hypothetical protein
MSALIDQKLRGENWGHFARRLGLEARYEGKTLKDNPFPPGQLHTIWEAGWTTEDNILRHKEMSNGTP